MELELELEPVAGGIEAAGGTATAGIAAVVVVAGVGYNLPSIVVLEVPGEPGRGEAGVAVEEVVGGGATTMPAGGVAVEAAAGCGGRGVVNGVSAVVGVGVVAGSESSAAGTMESTLAELAIAGAAGYTTTAGVGCCTSWSATVCDEVAAGYRPVAVVGREDSHFGLTLAVTVGREETASAATAAVSYATAAAATADWLRRRPVGELGRWATRPSRRWGGTTGDGDG